MHEIDRSGEFTSFLNWLKDEIVRRKADALLVSGDVFDVANPPVESRRMYLSFLASLVGTCCRNVVIVGGNHDSPALLDSEKEIFSALNIHVVGSVNNMSAADMIFELQGKNGECACICAAVPFAREIELRNYFDGDAASGEFSDKAYGALYRAVFEQAEKIRGQRNIPIIATGHLYAADLEGRLKNVKEGRSGDDGIKAIDVVGNLGSVHAGVFPDGFDYVALGHIHYSSTVAGNPKIRYSGSPFVLGFDEAMLPRHILCVDLDFAKSTECEKIEVPHFAEYRRISGDCDFIKTELEKYRAEKNHSKMQTYIELFYKKEIGVDIHQELEDAARQLPENVRIVSWKVQDVKAIFEGGADRMEIDELNSFDESEIFKKLILSKIADSAEADKAVEKFLPLFERIAGEVNADN